ncbi:MAG: hypothetical protein LBM59_03490 [Ruminococcus sp.]|jgi:hypothetical protein|nr:hypothetical protein [Ruminococcus sp.]
MNNITFDPHTQAVISVGMKALRKVFDTVELEIFLLNIKNPGFDYTAWRENLWEDITPEKLFENAKLTAQKYGVPDGVEQI